MTRVEHWPLKLDAAIEAARNKPFIWGEHDCCLWAADVIKELTGQDFGAGYRGRYKDARGALAILNEHGDISGLASKMLGEPVPAKMAQRGDVVMIESDGRESLGICAGLTVAATGPDGLAFVPMDRWMKAWRV